MGLAPGYMSVQVLGERQAWTQIIRSKEFAS
jgi:hypothetical protein